MGDLHFCKGRLLIEMSYFSSSIAMFLGKEHDKPESSINLHENAHTNERQAGWATVGPGQSARGDVYTNKLITTAAIN